jgi:dihydropteroate synthase
MRSPIFPPGRVTVMGVLNATPDSFSDGGRLRGIEAFVEAALGMQHAGAHVIDVGGESTRPGAETIPAALEIERVVPVIEALAKAVSVPISIDTRKAAVAQAALGAGARLVNDVSGGRHDPDLVAVVAASDVELLLGHLRGEPATMQASPDFDDVVAEVTKELAACVARAEAAGVRRERIAVDPGIGFGKTLEHNLALLANAGAIGARLGVPILVGPSRKSFLGKLTGDPVDDREAATVAACAVAVFAGANAIRVHDVAMGMRAATVGGALRGAAGSRGPLP